MEEQIFINCVPEDLSHAEEIKRRLGIEARSLLPPPKQRRLGDFE